MDFGGTLFLTVFFPIFYILYYIIPKRLKNSWLLIGSLFFLMFGRGNFVFYFFISTMISYFVMSKLWRLPKTISKKKILFFTCFIQLLVWGFFIHSYKKESGILYPFCYTVMLLQNIGSLFDCYKNKRPPKLFYYFLYSSCFPKLLFGPIFSYYEIEKELKERKITQEEWKNGAFLYFKGVIVYILLVKPLYILKTSLLSISSIFSAWLLLLVTALQIVLFFMSYSNMSIGLGKMLGFHWKQDFDYPLCLSKMKYFFKSWHHSLFHWWEKYFPILKIKVPLFFTYLLFMLFVSFAYGIQKNIIFWFLGIGFCIFLEEQSSKKKNQYILHFIFLLFLFGFLVQPDIWKTYSDLFRFKNPFITKEVLYLFRSYWVFLAIALIVACKIGLKWSSKVEKKSWYPIAQGLFYCLFLWISLIFLG